MKQRWKARLTFEPGSTENSESLLEIADGEGLMIPEGVFVFAGQVIAVKDGVGRLSCRQFVVGKHDGAIWLHRKGTPPIPGALTFE